MKADNPFDLFPAAMAKVAEEAVSIKQRSTDEDFYLAITAGVFISIVLSYSISPRPPALPRCIWDCQAYRWDLFFLGSDSVRIICGADLFTSTVLIVVAKASGRTPGQLAKTGSTSILVTSGGALLFVLLMVIRRIYDCQRRLGA